MLKNQIEWFTKLEVTSNDIQELPEESAQIESDAYIKDMVNNIMVFLSKHDAESSSEKDGESSR
jgi:hypothetical protein